MIATVDEERVYREKWREWEPKIAKTIRSKAVEGVVGISYEDLYSLAHQVMLYTIRGTKPENAHDITKAKFSTYFYNNLLNAIKTEYSKSGYARQWYKLKVTDKKTGEVTLLEKQFSTQGEAWSASKMVGRKRRYAEVIFERERRYKRIPPSIFSPLNGDGSGLTAAHEEGSSDIGDEVGNVHVDYRKAGTVGLERRAIPVTKISKVIGKRVADRTNRRILLLLYLGHTIREVARALCVGEDELQRRMKSLRRVAVHVLKETAS